MRQSESQPTIDVTPQEEALLEAIRRLGKFQKIEIKCDNDGRISYTITTMVRGFID